MNTTQIVCFVAYPVLMGLFFYMLARRMMARNAANLSALVNPCPTEFNPSFNMTIMQFADKWLDCSRCQGMLLFFYVTVLMAAIAIIYARYFPTEHAPEALWATLGAGAGYGGALIQSGISGKERKAQADTQSATVLAATVPPIPAAQAGPVTAAIIANPPPPPIVNAG